MPVNILIVHAVLGAILIVLARIYAGLLRRETRNSSSPDSSQERLLTVFAMTCFFVSGACGLLYQVVWTRKLILLFGTTAYAVSTVLSIFFLGLGLGSLFGGKLADKARRPLVVYGVFEVLIGAWAVLFIVTIDAGDATVVKLIQFASDSRIVGIGVRAVLAAALLFVPVFLMGATLPLLARFVGSGVRTRGRRIGLLYAANTVGAVLGCALTGFVLIASLGYTTTTLVGAMWNVIIGAIAMILADSISPAIEKTDSVDSMEPHRSSADTISLSPRARLLVLVAFAISGFCAIALETLWTRMLAIVFLGTTFAYTTMLTTILCGIAVGSAVAAPFVDKRRNAVFLLGSVLLFTGLSCLAMLSVFAGLPARLTQMQVDAGFNWPELVRAKFILSFMVLFVPTFLMGAGFPVAVRIFTASGNRLGNDVGLLYSVNTFGGVLGAIVGGYVLIPFAGTHWGISALAAAQVITGAVLMVTCPASRVVYKSVSLTLVAGLLAGTLYAMPKDIGWSLNQWYIPEEDEILHYREGVEGTVVVSGPKGSTSGSDRTLWINAVQATVSIERGVKMNRFQGILPLLFDRDPQTALFMCFGSGITAGTLGLSDFERIDAVEISKNVLEAAPLFASDNLDVLHNPKLRFHVDDGRNFLLRSADTYDVITFEPMPLAMAGVSTFYTTEYYRLCLSHLSPGGIVSQWAPLHSLSPSLVKDLIATFTQVFPEYCAWFINSDLFMIGSNAPLAIDYQLVERRLAAPAIKQTLDAVGFTDAPELLTCFFLSKQAVNGFASGGRAMSDDVPWAEFEAPKLMYERKVVDALNEIIPLYESPIPLIRFADGEEGARAKEAVERRYRSKVAGFAGLLQFYAGGPGAAPEKEYLNALDLDPMNQDARHYLQQIALAKAKTLVRWQEYDDAKTLLLDALRYNPEDAKLLELLGDLFSDLKDTATAFTYYERAVTTGKASLNAQSRYQELRQ